MPGLCTLHPSISLIRRLVHIKHACKCSDWLASLDLLKCRHWKETRQDVNREENQKIGSPLWKNRRGWIERGSVSGSHDKDAIRSCVCSKTRALGLACLLWVFGWARGGQQRRYFFTPYPLFLVLGGLMPARPMWCFGRMNERTETRPRRACNRTRRASDFTFI